MCVRCDARGAEHLAERGPVVSSPVFGQVGGIGIPYLNEPITKLNIKSYKLKTIYPYKVRIKNYIVKY